MSAYACDGGADWDLPGWLRKTFAESGFGGAGDNNADLGRARAVGTGVRPAAVIPGRRARGLTGGSAPAVAMSAPR